MTPRTLVRRSRPLGWRVGPVLVALAVAGSLAVSVGASPARAAEDCLRVAVESTYRVDPAEGEIHVALDIQATNLKPATSTRFFFFDTLSFGIQSGARSIAATADGKKLTVRTEDAAGYRQVRIRTPPLYYRQTHRTRLTFDIPSGKPRSASPVRVGPAHAAFVVWAWGDPGLANVRVEVPRRFDADVRTGPDGVPEPLRLVSDAGPDVYAAEDIDEPNQWFATVEASDPSSMTNVRLALPGRRVAIHAWPEDEEWLNHVADVLEEQLPDLEAAIGLPWPVAEELGVTEVSSAQIEGYAGIYDSRSDEIWISEELDDHVIVHEASHAWFDRRLYDERWINEGLADEYAARMVRGEASGPRFPAEPDDTAAFPLNAWPPPSRIDAETQAEELYGYEASWTLMHQLVTEVGATKMREIFESAHERRIPYVGAGPAEAVTGTNDWRRFLDELEEIGDSKEATSLFETWVLGKADAALLPEREAARTRYKALVESGGDWLPGLLVRRPMSAWQFDDAGAAMTLAETTLAERDQLRAATESLGLAFPAGLERTYESADSRDDLVQLGQRFAAWEAAATSVRSAREQLAVRRAPLVEIGLIGSEPDAAYQAAIAAFAAGDDAGALAGSSATLAVLGGAEEIGRGRALAAGTAIVTVVLLVVLLVVYLVYRHRRRTSVGAFAVASAPASVGGPGEGSGDPAGPDGHDAIPTDPVSAVSGAVAVPPEPYATLAATPGPADVGANEPGAVGGAEPD